MTQNLPTRLTDAQREACRRQTGVDLYAINHNAPDVSMEPHIGGWKKLGSIAGEVVSKLSQSFYDTPSEHGDEIIPIESISTAPDIDGDMERVGKEISCLTGKNKIYAESIHNDAWKIIRTLQDAIRVSEDKSIRRMLSYSAVMVLRAVEIAVSELQDDTITE